MKIDENRLPAADDSADDSHEFVIFEDAKM